MPDKGWAHPATMIGKTNPTRQEQPVSSPYLHQIKSLVESIDYPARPHHLLLSDQSGGVVEVRLEVSRPDIDTGEVGWGFGGARRLDPGMTDGQIVRSIFSMFMAYEEHECREHFTFGGVRIFGPHITLKALLKAGEKVDG